MPEFSIKNPKKGQNGGSEGSKNKWRPKPDATSDIRLFGYPLNDREEPFVEIWMHYNVGYSFLCPAKMKNAKCPVCVLSNQFLTKAKVDFEKGKPDWKIGKDLSAKQRFVAAMVDRADPELTPKFWEFNEKIYLELLQKLVDRDYKSYLDPLKGFDLTVTNQKLAKATFATTSFQFRPVQCRLADTDKKIKDIVEGLPKIETVYEMLTEEQVKQRLNDFWQKGDASLNVDAKQAATTAELGNYLGDQKELDVDSAFEKALDD